MPTVLHLINTAGPGGAETVFRDLVDGLPARGWKSFAVVPEFDWLTEQLVARGHEPIIEVCRGRFDLAAHLWRLARLVRRNSIDVIHSHLWGPSVEASLLGAITGIPVVCTIHGRGDLSPEERMRGLKFRILNKGASRVVFVSESLRRFFLEQGPLHPERTTVISNGIDTSLHIAGGTGEGATARGARAAFGVPAGERFVVGAVGNLRPVKRYDVFLRAAALLKERSPDYFFVIVGQTPRELHAELLSLRDELGLQGHVHFTGFRNDVERAFTALDLFTITSDSEGFSIATVQAMASELPIVATRCGGPEEILEDGRTGVLVDTGSPEQLAEAIDRLRHDPEAHAALGRAARVDAEIRFSLEAQVQSYERLYETVIAERRDRARSRGGAR